MTVSLKYHEILEENLVIELEWLREEFEILFNSKIEEHTEMDKRIANDILDYILENTDVDGDIILLELLDEALDNIERRYFIIFNWISFDIWLWAILLLEYRITRYS